MTRYEYFKNASIEELAELLCDIVDNVDTSEQCNCDSCLATKYCKKGQNGFIEWLKKDVEYCHNTKAVKVWD